MLTNMVQFLTNFDRQTVYTCGKGNFTFEGLFPEVISIIVTIIKIGVPILLIILGMIDLGKAVMAQKEDEIKKGQGLFIKRLIAAILVFLVVFAVQIVVRFIAKGDKQSIMSCIHCFVNGEATSETANPNNPSKGCWTVPQE